MNEESTPISFDEFVSGKHNEKEEKQIIDASESKKKKSHHRHHHHKKSASKTENSKESSEKFIVKTSTESKAIIEPKKESKTIIEPKKESSQSKSSFDISQYKILKKVGEGSFGEVFKVQEKQTGLFYAAKVSKKVLGNGEEEDDDEFLDIDLEREINNSYKFNHPAIVKFIGFSLFDFTGMKKPVMIIEFMGGGSLNNLLKKAKSGFPDQRWDDTKKLIIIYGIAAAMEYLHKNGIIHRDLKPDNILMDEDLNPKLADFGLSKTLHSNPESKSESSKNGFKGTILYTPPEVFQNQKYTKACDVYAFALITYEIITNETPFEKCDLISLIKQLYHEKRPNFNSTIPDSYKELIESCWAQDPQSRPTFTEIVNKIKDDPGFITDNVDESAFLKYVDYIEEFPISFKKNKIIPSFKEFCKKKSLQKINETDDLVEIKSISTPVKEQTQNALNDDVDDDSLDELSSKSADELFETWRKLFYGKGVPLDQKKSLKYIKLAADKGHIIAMFTYASIINSGIGTRINRIEASSYFKKAADEGHIESMVIYASMMNRGDGVPINKKEAFDYFKKAADNGHIDSMYKYSMMLYKRYNSMDNKDVKVYCKKAADNGHINAMYLYATILSKDNNNDNLEEIKIFFKTAAENGHVDAMFQYAEILSKEKQGQIREEAVKYYKMAADNGNVDAMLRYAEMLSKGNAVDVDKAQSAMYYKMAADRGNKKAMLIYADILSKGIGIPANKKESKFYIQLAKINK